MLLVTCDLQHILQILNVLSVPLWNNCLDHCHQRVEEVPLAFQNIWWIFIPLLPTHISLKPYLSRPRCVPVGLIVVCPSALDIIDESMIQICCNSEISKGLTFNLESFWRLIIYANVSHVCVRFPPSHLFNIIFRFPSENERGCCPYTKWVCIELLFINV